MFALPTFRILLVAALALACSTSVLGQADPVAVYEKNRQQSGQLAEQWLASADPRIRAWGAYLVLRDRHTDLASILLSMVSAYDTSQHPDKDQHDAMLPVLDALIQLNIPVPASDAEKLVPEFPAQSLILLSRSPDGAPAELLNIFRTAENQHGAWLAAGNLLASRRTPAFAAALLSGMTVSAHVTISDPLTGVGVGSGGSTACGFGRTPPAKAGWPEVGNYVLSECVSAGAVVLAPGMDTAYYHRAVNASYSTATATNFGCGFQPDLARQHFLVTLLYAAPNDPPLQAQLYHGITWSGDEAYRNAMEGYIAGQQERFAAVAQRLEGAGLLSAAEAAVSRPRLRVTISDQRSQSRSALPPIPAAANVSFESSQ